VTATVASLEHMTAPAAARGGCSEPLVLANLLNDLDALVPLLLREIRCASWLDAYLIAAGMNQIAEDWLHPDPAGIGEISRALAARRRYVAAGAARTAAAAATRLRRLRRRRSVRDAARWQRDLAALVDALAERTLAPPLHDATAPMLAAATVIAARLPSLPGDLRREVLRLPSCFRSFDQQPADVEQLVDKVARRRPKRDRPIVVAGIRTSGSYLAPLAAAALRRQGYRSVGVLTIRPGCGLRAPERRLLRNAGARGGAVLLTDDPPATGESLAAAAGDVERLGVPRTSIVLLLQSFGSGADLPPALVGYERVLLPWECWAIHALVAPPNVCSVVGELLAADSTVVAVERRSLPPPTRMRAHVAARYRFELVDSAGVRSVREIYVKGAGLGYLGRHALAVERALPGRVPRIHGIVDSLLFREWLPDERRAESSALDEAALAREVAAYAVQRRRALAVDEDVAQRLTGRSAVWEVASRLASGAFGRAWPLVHVAVVGPAFRRILRARSPSVVDGAMDLENWFTAERGRAPLVKVDADEKAFSSSDLSCYDAAFDVAGAAAAAGARIAPVALRDAYEDASGEQIDDERWLLYQLVALWSCARERPERAADADRAAARALQTYLAALYLEDVEPATEGPLCALDVDGVLETETLGFPGATPASMLSLRGLARHGFRTVLVTGRSVGEVVERCRAYRLAGGVAEYGSATYDASNDRIRIHVPAEDAHALDEVRARLLELDGVRVDPDYSLVVRASRVDGRRTRRALDPDTVAKTLAGVASTARIRVVQGEAQTDFVARDVDKGTGVRALIGELGGDAASMRPLAAAVGDTVEDLPLLALAERASAPGHAAPAVVGPRVRRERRPYQQGLALAVGRLLGHRPGACPVCRAPTWPSASAFLLAILGAREGGRSTLCRRALALRAAAAKVRVDGATTAATAATGRVASLAAHIVTPLYRDGYALVLASGITAVVGFAYWAVAAHVYSAAAIGLNSVLISSMMFLAGISQLNLSNVLVRFVPTAGTHTRRLVLASYGASAIVAAAASAGFIAVAARWSATFRVLDSSVGLQLWFVGATIVWCIFVLEDGVLTGLGQAVWTPIESGFFSVAKLALLLALATLVSTYGVFASWTVAVAASVVPVNFFVFRRFIPRAAATPLPPESGVTRREFIRYVAADYVGASCWLASTTLLPVIVAQEAGAAAAGYFSLAWIVSFPLLLVSANMGASLIVHGLRNQGELTRLARQMVVQTWRVVVPAAVALAVCGPYLLRVFGAAYSHEGATLLRILAVAAVANVVTTIAVSAARVRRRMTVVVAVLASQCALSLGLAVPLLRVYGIVGVGLAWLIGQLSVAVAVAVAHVGLRETVGRLRALRPGWERTPR
jgi:O-antigen/teichoic acid export membrane protein/hydroxymethylpyrimidine pyrophosphatase-like HAD family hydrolase